MNAREVQRAVFQLMTLAVFGWALLVTSGIALVVGCGRDVDKSSRPSVPSSIEPVGPASSGPSTVATESVETENAISEPRQSASDPERPILADTSDASDWRNRTARALSENDIESAYQHARKAMAIDPEHSHGMFLMARVLGRRNRFHEAVRLLDRAAESDPAVRQPALGQTAQWLVMQGDWSEAEFRFSQLLNEVPDAMMVRRELASLFIRQGRRYEAAKHIQVMCRHGDINESELRQLLSVAVPFPNDTSLGGIGLIGPLGIARGYTATGKWNKAIEVISEDAEYQDVDSSLTKAFLGRAYAMLADPQALEMWREDLSQAAEENADYWFALGSHEARKDRHPNAIRYFCKSIVHDATCSETYERMSYSLHGIGLSDRADDAHARAQQIAKTHEIGKELSETTDRKPEQIQEIVDLLHALRRPGEEYAWRAIQIAYNAASLSQEYRDHQLSEINTLRSKLLETETPSRDLSFLLCGVDPEQIEIPASKE